MWGLCYVIRRPPMTSRRGIPYARGQPVWHCVPMSVVEVQPQRSICFLQMEGATERPPDHHASPGGHRDAEGSNVKDHRLAVSSRAHPAAQCLAGGPPRGFHLQSLKSARGLEELATVYDVEMKCATGGCAGPQ